MFAITSPIVAATLWLLIAFSVVTWSLILMKGWLQWRLARRNAAFGKAFWSAHGLRQAASVAESMDGPLARVCRAGFAAVRGLQPEGERSLQQSGDRQDILERCLRSQLQKEQNRLEGGLMILASIGSTAPFVGLFGTVWGIMHALQDIGATGSAGLDVVAGPIGEALIATAIGIATAIPAVLAYNYGVRQVRLSGAALEEFATDFLHLIMKADFRVE